MKSQIQEFVKRYRICQTRKLVRKKTKPILTDISDRAFNKVALDIVGSLRAIALSNTYILTIQDLLTKYSIYAPLPDIRAETIAAAFINYFICRFGCSRSIFTDQGLQFHEPFHESYRKKYSTLPCY